MSQYLRSAAASAYDRIFGLLVGLMEREFVPGETSQKMHASYKKMQQTCTWLKNTSLPGRFCHQGRNPAVAGWSPNEGGTWRYTLGL